MSRIVLLVVAAAVAVVIGAAAVGGGGNGSEFGPEPGAQRIQARITDVTDGDTIRVRAFEAERERYRVRLIGIDTPETHAGIECGGPEATDALIRLAFGAGHDTDADGLLDEPAGRGPRVVLMTDPTQDVFDVYGRLLAYVTRSGIDLGARQLAAGWAEVYVFERRFRRYGDYRDAQRRARASGRGVWGRCDGGF